MTILSSSFVLKKIQRLEISDNLVILMMFMMTIVFMRKTKRSVWFSCVENEMSFVQNKMGVKNRVQWCAKQSCVKKSLDDQITGP